MQRLKRNFLYLLIVVLIFSFTIPSMAEGEAQPISEDELNSDVIFYEGFETGDSLQQNGDADIERTEEHAAAGAYSLKVAPTANNNYSGVALLNPSQRPMLPTGTYKLTAKVLSEEIARLGVRVETVNSGGQNTYGTVGRSIVDLAANEWVDVVMEFTVPGDHQSVTSIVFHNEFQEDNLVFFLDEVELQVIVEPDPGGIIVPEWDLTLPSIKEVYKDYFKIGNIMSAGQTSNDENTAMYVHHYNSMTAENDMKPQYMSSAKGVYDYTNGDRLIEWAHHNNIEVHGHTLAWHSQSARWLTTGEDNNPLTRAEAKENLAEFISNVAGHFKGKVVSWDVVNEAFDGGSAIPTDWKTVLRTNSPWYRAYANGADASIGESGADYIYDAFVFARLADPNAILYYNDYNENEPWKREAMALMAEDLNEKWKADERNTDPDRLLVEGIGMQAHYWIQTLDPQTVEDSIVRFIEAGVKVSVTELDIPSQGSLTAEDAIEQARLYAELFMIFKKYADHINTVTIWGKTDSQSWRSSGSPVLFDSAQAAKIAYYAVIDPEGFLGIEVPVDPDPSDPEPNVIYYEGFETGDSLQQNGDAEIERTEEHASEGAYSLKVAPTANNNYSGVALRNETLETPMLPTGTYKLTAKVLSEENARLGVRVETKNSGGGDTYGTVGSAFVNLIANEWANVEMVFAVPGDHQSVTSIVFHNNFQVADLVFFLDEVKLEVVVEPDPEDIIIPEWDLTLQAIKEVYKDYFKIGNIMSASQTTNDENSAMFAHHYNSMTAENDMKPQSMSSAKGVYDYTNGDTLIDWAQSHNIEVHGHTLAWHSQSARWLTTGEDNNPLTRAEAKENLEAFISNVAGHFKGKVVSWDVVNEAFNDSGSELPTDWKSVLRTNSPWYRAYENGADESLGESGSDYIYDAFVFARLADPGAILYYNDYNENVPRKREAMALMAEDLNEKWKTDERNTDPDRLLVEGIGMQAHYWIQTLDPQSVEDSIVRFIDAGVNVSVTELDIPSQGTLTPEDELKQARLYAELFMIFKKYADRINTVTIWGKADSQSWRASGSPVLFDNSYAAKPAFYAVIDPEGYLGIEEPVDPDPTDPDPVVPAAPTDVTAKAISSSEIEISWTAVDQTVGYNVYVADAADGLFNQVNAQLIMSTEFVDRNLSPSTTYYYKVTAVNDAGESTPSAVVQATTNSASVPTPWYPSPIPQPAPSGDINATVDKDGLAKVTINATQMTKAISTAQNGTLKLIINGTADATKLSLTIPQNEVKAAQDAGIKWIEVGSGLATVKLPLSLIESANGAEIVLEITKVDHSTLPASQQETVGSNTVFEFKLTIGGQEINDFAQGQEIVVSLPYTLQSGENPVQIVIYYLTDDGQLEVIKNGRYNEDTGMVDFMAKHFSKYAAIANLVKFNDAQGIAWASDSIDGLAARGIVKGIGEGAFAPNNSVTRAEFIQMLMHTLDLNEANAESTFTDVEEHAWYYNSVASAQQLGIVNGLTNGSFGINNKITRQDMATMTYRAIQVANMTLSEERLGINFNDLQDIASYAKEAVGALNRAGIVNGVGNDRFDPKGTTTRAQAAVILFNLLMKN